MSQSKKITHDDIVYELCEDNKTAKVLGHQNTTIDTIIFPRSIVIDSNEYIVTGICKNAFDSYNIKSVEFAPDSQVRIIEDCSFQTSSIQELTIPPHLTYIGERAFYYCSKLKKVTIPPDSELSMIGKDAFKYSSIQKFTIPPHLTEICEGALSICNKLSTIEIPQNSELKTIGINAFAYSYIDGFYIPSKLVELNDGWCKETPYLKRITVDANNPTFSVYNDQFMFDKNKKEISFCFHDLKKLKIPDFIEKIGKYSFMHCSELYRVEFSSDSNLKVVDGWAFYSSSIQKFNAPPHLNSIENNAFQYCKELKCASFPVDSEIQKIGNEAFLKSEIRSFVVHRNLTDIGKNAFSVCQKLKIVFIEDGSKLKYFNIDAVSGCRNVVLVVIPSNIQIIST